jgi:hypothetical protein
MTTTLDRTVTGRFTTPEIRIEGRDKVSGRMQYTADIVRPGTLWAAFTTSPHAHAKILRIDTTEAKAVVGVRAVLTAADIGKRLFGRQLHDWPVLAWDTVRMIGDRVAAVAADTREAAEEAARLVVVEYEELPAVLDPFAALADGAPILHPERASYFHMAFAGKEPMPVIHPNVQGWTRNAMGDADLEPHFSAAHKVYEHQFQTPRQHAGYIEPRSTIVWVDDDGTVHVQSPNKMPFALRFSMAKCLEMPAERIVIETSAIGGDFGGKGTTTDELPCYFLARATGRPVRYVERYSEELGYAPTRHAGWITLRTAVDAAGRFQAHHSSVIYDGGAYAGGKVTPRVVPGGGYSTVPYFIPNALIESRAVYTNTVPGAHVRAPNDLQIFFAWEQHVDVIARDLGIDPIELRKRNLIGPGQQSVTHEQMRHHNGVQILDVLAREGRYGSPLPPGRGRGIALTMRHTGAGKTAVKLTLHADGRVSTTIGAPENGAGQLTLVARIVAETLGIELARVDVRRGNTADALNDPGTGGSRVTNIVGRAAYRAALALKERVEADASTPLDERTIEDLAARACAQGPIDAVGECDGNHAPGHAADFSYTGFSIEVEVDRETGAIRVLDALCVADVAQIINPIAHQGQIDGGFAAGIGSALMEDLTIDESGKVQTLSLGEYKLPTMKDMPPLRTVLVRTADGEGPYGAKMAGELSNTGVAPAIANAVFDAVGVRLSRFPFTSERVFEALQTQA